MCSIDKKQEACRCTYIILQPITLTAADGSQSPTSYSSTHNVIVRNTASQRIKDMPRMVVKKVSTFQNVVRRNYLPGIRVQTRHSESWAVDCIRVLDFT